MTNILRIIRQRLLGQRAFSRYLLYAIGEIILVVLGILIALKINDINTNRLNERMEVNYLSAIAVNLDEDIHDLQYRLGVDSLRLTSYSQLIKAFISERIKSSDSRLDSAIFNSSTISYFNPFFCKVMNNRGSVCL